MRKLFKDLTEENIVNIGKVVAIFIVVLCVVLLVRVVTEPHIISLPNIK